MNTMSLISQFLNTRSSSRALHINSRRPASRKLRIEPLEHRLVPTTATHFAVLAPTSVAPGEAFMLTVKALDAQNNLVADYSGQVHFSSTDNAAIVPADTTQTHSVGTYIAFLNTVGNWTISVLDAANNISGTSGLIAVGASAAATTVAVSATPNPSAFGPH